MKESEIMIAIHRLSHPNKDGLIPAFEICKVSYPMPFEGNNKRFWKISASRVKGFIDIKNKYNDYSFCIDLVSGDLDVYCCGELTTTNNQIAIAEKYKELELTPPLTK